MKRSQLTSSIHAAIALAAALGACADATAATAYGTVTSSTAVTAPVNVARRQCSDSPAMAQPPTSGGGAVLGALVGGALGHSVGQGLGRAAATGLGAVAGGIVGDRTEAAATPPAAVPMRECHVVNTVERRVVGYDVTYEYEGQRHQTRLLHDPGARIALDVSVAPAGAALPSELLGALPVSPDNATAAPSPVSAPVPMPVPTPAPPIGIAAPPIAGLYPWPGYDAYGWYGAGYLGYEAVPPIVIAPPWYGGYGVHGPHDTFGGRHRHGF